MISSKNVILVLRLKSVQHAWHGYRKIFESTTNLEHQIFLRSLNRRAPLKKKVLEAISKIVDHVQGSASGGLDAFLR